MVRDKVIIDTEQVTTASSPFTCRLFPGVDDVLAILLALASPELDVKALTITFGNTLAPSAYQNTLKLFACLSREFAANSGAEKRYARNLIPAEREGGKKVVLALGAEGPVGGERDLAAYFHGTDGLSNISQTHPHFTPPPLPTSGATHDYLDIEEKKPGYEVMLDILRSEEEGTVRIIALGPLSNVALAYRADPETFKRVREVVWMGGALDVPGNTSPTAEFNCFADPYAAQEVVEAVTSGAFTLTMCPLDITTPHTIHFDKLIHDVDSNSQAGGQTEQPLKEFISAMLIRVRGLMKSFNLPDAMEMHDPMAVWYVIATVGTDPRVRVGGSAAGGQETGKDKGWPEGWEGVKRVFAVERKGELSRGMCVVDRRGTGEQSFLRTESDFSSGGSNNEKSTNNANAEDAAAGKEEEAGEGGPRSAPWVVSKTPGSDVLEEMLLARVFGA